MLKLFLILIPLTFAKPSVITQKKNYSVFIENGIVYTAIDLNGDGNIDEVSAKSPEKK